MATIKKEEKRGAHLSVPNHLQKPKKEYVPTGKPRGRAKGQNNKTVNKSINLPKKGFYVEKIREKTRDSKE